MSDKKPNTSLVLKSIMGSFVYITKLNKDGYNSMQVVIRKDHPQIKEVKKAELRTLVGKYGNEAAKKQGLYKLPLRDGDKESDSKYLKGCYFFNCRSFDGPPNILNRQKTNPTESDLKKYCFSGCFFHVAINFYAMKEKKGVAVALNSVMLNKEGERIDGTISASEAFKDFEAEDTEDDLDLDADDMFDDDEL